MIHVSQGTASKIGIENDRTPLGTDAPKGSGIRLRGVSKRYGATTVVDNINLTIEPGEFMTLLGPSGSGKTTTLNMIAGFTEITEGELLIHGRPITNVPAHKRELGVVFQNYALFPHMTVRDNIEYPLKRRRIDKPRRQSMVRKALEMVRMEDFSDRFPSELSGGQQQRIALARALVFGPNVLLMDEPLGALDKKLREWLQGEIKRIHREVGTTFVFVTHDQEEALSMSDRIAVFNNGKIEQVGTAVELYESPATLFVGQFLGESTILEGTVQTDHHGNSVIEFAGHKLIAHGETSSERATILIRPENLQLLPASDSRESPSGHNAIPATVSTATYLGSGWRYEVSLPGGITGVVRTAHDTHRFAPGQGAIMAWRITAGVLLPVHDQNNNPA
ncbi:ABC transporter ATP-binding protein [Arthrobacter sp. S2(2024)]|uniref:ABC transporter ATP-binding protein n=1 Tax=Arthrobacter sp. S2(2024) TaxID=3111911 RepID=UPI002FC729E1